MKSRVYKYKIPGDWTQEAGYLTCLFCIPNSPQWRQTITGLVSSLKNGRTWDESTGSVIEAQAMGLEVFESMAMCDLETQLERIADTLEEMNVKLVERYTYQEFIDDIENAFGFGSILGKIISGIVGLMPNLKAKVDFTRLAQSFIETYTRWKPVHGFLAAQSASLAVIAAAAGTSKILALGSLIFQALDVVGNGWRSLIFGDKNLWDDLIKPLWALFISDDEGGEGGNNPDDDPTNRIAMLISQTTLIQLTINSLCCDTIERIIEQTPEKTIVPSDSTDIDPGGSPPTSQTGITWDDQAEPEDEKCQAAHFLVDWLILFYGSREWENIEGTTSPVTFASIVTSVLSSIPPIGITLAGMSQWIGQALAYFAAGNTDIYDTVRSVLQDNYQEAVCALYGAETPTGALAALVSVLEANGLNPLHSWAVETFIRQNNIVGLLWFGNDLVDYSSKTSDCSFCGEVPVCLDWEIQWGTLISQSYIGSDVWRIIINSEWDSSLNYHRAIVRVQDPVDCAFDVILAEHNLGSGQWGRRLYNGVNYSGSLVVDSLPLEETDYSTYLEDIVTFFIQATPGSGASNNFTVTYYVTAHPH